MCWKMWKKISVFEGHVLVIVCQIWLNKSDCVYCKNIDLASRGQRCSLPLQCNIWEVQHQMFIDCKTAYCLLHGEQEYLKNAKYKVKEIIYWCFSYHHFIVSIWISAYSRSGDTALLHHSWWDFPSHFSSVNSQLCVLFSHCVHYFIFLTTTKPALSQSCVTTLASGEGCQLRAHYYIRQD